MSAPSGHGEKKVTPPIFIYRTEFFSANHVKLTNNNPNKEFESVKLPLELEKV